MMTQVSTRTGAEMPGIIVGVDGSSHSRLALQWALSEAAVRHAPLTVLSACHDRAVTCTAET